MKKREIIHKKALVSQIADKCSIDDQTVNEVINGLQEIILESINNDCNININGFLSFRCIELAQRVGIDSTTGEKIIIPPIKRVNAVVSESFQKKIKQGESNE